MKSKYNLGQKVFFLSHNCLMNATIIKITVSQFYENINEPNTICMECVYELDGWLGSRFTEGSIFATKDELLNNL